MAHRARKALCAVFLAVAGAGVGAGIIPTPVTAPEPAAAASAPAGVTANAVPIIVAANAAEDRRALNEAIADPSDENIQTMINRGVGETRNVHIIRDSIGQMDVPAGQKADDVTEEQRSEALRLIRENQAVYETSAPTAEEAKARGLDERLATYFDECRGDAPAVTTYAQAQALNGCMEDLHWEREAKPLLVKVGIGAGAVGAAGVAAGTAAIIRKQQDKKRHRDYWRAQYS